MFLESLQLFLLITACLYVRGRSASISPSIVHISRVYSEASLTCRDDFNIDNDNSYSDISTSVNCNWIPQDDIELVRYIDAGKSNVVDLYIW